MSVKLDGAKIFHFGLKCWCSSVSGKKSVTAEEVKSWTEVWGREPGPHRLCVHTCAWIYTSIKLPLTSSNWSLDRHLPTSSLCTTAPARNLSVSALNQIYQAQILTLVAVLRPIAAGLASETWNRKPFLVNVKVMVMYCTFSQSLFIKGGWNFYR